MRIYLNVLVGSFWLVSAMSAEDNLNGENLIGQTPHGGKSSLFPKHFKDYPRGAEYVDIYSPPIKTLYSQVFWTRLPSVPLPEELVERFKGKAMAIIGFETDQVQRTQKGDVSVPITVAYNHHNDLVMEGSESKWTKVSLDDPQLLRQHGGHLPVDENGDSWVIQDAVASPKFPTSATLGGGNGGEYRKTFHGYAPGIAQVVGSPKAFSVTPMQIDTWNRDKMNITGGPFVSGAVPRNTLAPIEGPDALYSGLLECPLTTRIRKVIDGEYTIAVAGNCADAILTPEECWSAAQKLFPSVQIVVDQGSNTTLPDACSVTSDGSGHAAAFFNYAASSVPCGGIVKQSAGEVSALINFSVSIDATSNLVTMKLTGPSDVWFGVGYNATAMSDQPWTVIVDGAGVVTERLLGSHAPGKLLPVTVRVLSNSVEHGRRIVIFTRPLDAEHNPFQVTDTSVNIINAIGDSGTFGYHKNKGTVHMTLLATNLATCVCAHKPAPFGQAKGSFVYMGEDSVGFNNRCAPQPRIDLLAQRNPTCDIRTYTGGQLACHHMWSLLDADQEIPWPDQPIEYSIKIRVWYQEYDPSYHQQVTYLGHLFSIGAGADGIGFGAEYDVPQCPKGTPTKDCVHEITGTFDVDDIFHTGNVKVNLVAAHFHCHAPTCLDMAVYNNKTGELLCKEFAVYGGTGKIDDRRFDEPGYIAVPPCIWGSEEFGLESPPDVTGMTVTVIKHTNNTYGHHGEMAHGEIFVVEQPKDQFLV